MDRKFARLKKYFDGNPFGIKTGYNRCGDRTLGAISLEYLNPAFQKLVEDSVIDNSGLFFDAGCGDGRVVALTAGVYKIPSLGMDSNHKVIPIARANISNLRKLDLVCGTAADITQGDFSEDRTYLDAGIDFKVISTIFNYMDGYDSITSKIARLSPIGTVFLFQSIGSKPMK